MSTNVRYDGYKIIVAVLLLGILPLLFLGSPFRQRLLVLFLVFSLFTLSLDIVFGHTDQLFLFMGALAGVGAYTTALTADFFGVTPWLTILLGALFAGTVGLIVSYVAARRRLTVILISILTLSLQLAFMEFFIGARDITGGSTGFRFSGLEIGFVGNALNLNSTIVLYYTLLVVLTVVLFLYYWLINSRFGLAFRAIREDEVAAESSGIDVIKYKTVAGFTSAFIIGFVGPLYVQLESYILPSMFSFQSVDVMVLIMLVLGGRRTIFGPIVGAGLVIYINNIVLSNYLQSISQWTTAIFGFMLIVLFLYFRRGIVPALTDVVRG
ncbi:MAG: branched-chain amino acid ABC transporter permease [Halobacteria archaeon]|nr:branched-chain amino acid ABC transporter permease [Halobacteria archaeon]